MGTRRPTLSRLPNQSPIIVTAPITSHAAKYPIVASGALDADYSIHYVNGTLTINRAPLTITANNAGRVYLQANPSFTAVYTGFVNGDTAASLTPPPNLVTPAIPSSPVGAYPISASGAVDPDYTISYANGTLNVVAFPMPTLTSMTPDRTTVGKLHPGRPHCQRLELLPAVGRGLERHGADDKRMSPRRSSRRRSR